MYLCMYLHVCMDMYLCMYSYVCMHDKIIGFLNKNNTIINLPIPHRFFLSIYLSIVNIFFLLGCWTTARGRGS